MPFGKDFIDRSSDAVAEVESVSSVEVVVVVAPSSGSYADANLAWGILGALATLVFILHSPWDFLPELVTVNVVLVGLVFWWLSRSLPWMRRLVTRRGRRRAQVEEAARAAFMKNSVGATRSRTGVLVYLSLMERECLIIPDYGAQGKVPGAVWNSVNQDLAGASCAAQMEERFFKALADLKEPLGERLPIEPDDRNELPNAPVML